MAATIKVLEIKIFDVCQPINFWNPFTLVLYFYNFWPELQMATITPGDKIFDGNMVSNSLQHVELEFQG